MASMEILAGCVVLANSCWRIRKSLFHAKDPVLLLAIVESTCWRADFGMVRKTSWPSATGNELPLPPVVSSVHRIYAIAGFAFPFPHFFGCHSCYSPILSDGFG
jgi:hypothetical protein